MQDPSYTVTLPAGALSVTFEASCPVAADDTKATTTGVASGGRLVFLPLGDASLTDVVMYSPRLTPTTAHGKPSDTNHTCAPQAPPPAHQRHHIIHPVCTEDDGAVVAHEFYDATSGDVWTDVCPAGEHDGIEGVAANDCRATAAEVQGGVQLYSLGPHDSGTQQDVCGSGAVQSTTRRRVSQGDAHPSLRIRNLVRLLTEGGDDLCCAGDGSCMPTWAGCA